MVLYCWLGLLTCKTVSRITYTVLMETLNTGQSIGHVAGSDDGCNCWRRRTWRQLCAENRWCSDTSTKIQCSCCYKRAVTLSTDYSREHSMDEQHNEGLEKWSTDRSAGIPSGSDATRRSSRTVFETWPLRMPSVGRRTRLSTESSPIHTLSLGIRCCLWQLSWQCSAARPSRYWAVVVISCIAKRRVYQRLKSAHLGREIVCWKESIEYGWIDTIVVWKDECGQLNLAHDCIDTRTLETTII